MVWQNNNEEKRNRLPADWKTRRLRVLRRDRFACQWRERPGADVCGERANQCDHIVRGEDHWLENLQALCERHHRTKTAREGNAAKTPRKNTPEKFAWSI